MGASAVASSCQPLSIGVIVRDHLHVAGPQAALPRLRQPDSAGSRGGHPQRPDSTPLAARFPQVRSAAPWNGRWLSPVAIGWKAEVTPGGAGVTQSFPGRPSTHPAGCGHKAEATKRARGRSTSRPPARPAGECSPESLAPLPRVSSQRHACALLGAEVVC